MRERKPKRADAIGEVGGSAIGDSLCGTVLPGMGGLILRAAGPDNGFRSRCHYSRLTKIDISLPAASVPGGVVLLSLICGAGTALPIFVAAFLLAYSPQSAGKG